MAGPGGTVDGDEVPEPVVALVRHLHPPQTQRSVGELEARVTIITVGRGVGCGVEQGGALGGVKVPPAARRRVRHPPHLADGAGGPRQRTTVRTGGGTTTTSYDHGVWNKNYYHKLYKQLS